MTAEVMMPPPSFNIFKYIYFASLFIIPLAIISFFVYEVFKKEVFSIKKKLGMLGIFFVFYLFVGIGHTFIIGDHNFFQEINSSVKNAFSVAFFWHSIYGTIIPGAHVIGGIVLVLVAWFSYSIGNKLSN